MRKKLFWVKLFKESHFSGKDAKLRFLNHVHYEARLKAGEFYDQFKKKKGNQIPPIDTFRRWLGGGKRSLASTISANKESKKMKNRHGKYPLLDDLIRNHFICLIFSSYHLTVRFYLYICTSLWNFDFFFAFLYDQKKPKIWLGLISRGVNYNCQIVI